MKSEEENYRACLINFFIIHYSFFILSQLSHVFNNLLTVLRNGN
jgi:hypothetical protein